MSARPTPVNPGLPRPARLEPVAALAGARVLVVDDTAVVAQATSRILETFGCSTTISRSHADATRRLAEPLAWDLVLADVDLGDGDGRTLVGLARARGAAIVITSGQPDTLGRDATGVRYLPKPWSIDQLLSTVEEALASRA